MENITQITSHTLVSQELSGNYFRIQHVHGTNSTQFDLKLQSMEVDRSYSDVSMLIRHLNDAKNEIDQMISTLNI